MCQQCWCSPTRHTATVSTLKRVILHVPFLTIHHLCRNVVLTCSVLFYCNVGWCIKDSAVHCSQQWLVAELLGLGITDRVRGRAKGMGFFCVFFFSLCVECDKHFVLFSWHVNSTTLRTTTTIRDDDVL